MILRERFYQTLLKGKNKILLFPLDFVVYCKSNMCRCSPSPRRFSGLQFCFLWRYRDNENKTNYFLLIQLGGLSNQRNIQPGAKWIFPSHRIWAGNHFQTRRGSVHIFGATASEPRLRRQIHDRRQHGRSLHQSGLGVYVGRPARFSSGQAQQKTDRRRAGH